jgi:hypothetical protein
VIRAETTKNEGPEGRDDVPVKIFLEIFGSKLSCGVSKMDHMIERAGQPDVISTGEYQ